MNDLATSESCSGSSGLWKGVDLALEQAHVGVHGRAGVLAKWLGHERSPAIAFVQRDLFDEVAERHHVVGHRERVGETQIDLLLAGRTFVVAELHRDAHGFQGVDSVPAEVGGRVVHGLVEIAGVVSRNGHRSVVRDRASSRKNSISGWT